MNSYTSTHLDRVASECAPDGSEVFPLLRLTGGSLAVFRLEPGKISRAIRHPELEEIWFVLEGRGKIWRKQYEKEEILSLAPGICLTIPKNTEFQFRAEDSETLVILGVTMPPWAGNDNAENATGPWNPGEP